MEILQFDEINKKIEFLYGNEYSLLEYYDDTKKIRLKHNICKSTWIMNCNYFFSRNMCHCPTCKKHNRNKEFLEKVNLLTGDEYEPLSNYVASMSYIKFRHKKCNQIVYIKPKEFLEGKRCGTCAKIFDENDKLIKKVCELCNSEFLVSDKEVLNSNMKITWCSKECKEQMKENICKACGKKFISKIHRFYCSKECKEDICKVCGKSFFKKNSESYCSEECRNILYTHVCKSCGKKFISQQNRAFCSPECKIAYASIKTETSICKNCKIPFKYKGTKIDFCSSECRMEFSVKEKTCKKDKINEKNLTDIISDRVSVLINKRKEAVANLENTIDYRLINGFTDSIKERVKNRDNRKCFICECNIDIDVHHIIPQRMGGAHKENNLITLCRKCHRYIETGNEEYAIRKCLKNAKEYFGFIELNSKSFEKVPVKTQLEIIEQDLLIFWNKFKEVEIDDSLELREKLSDIIDDVSSCIKDYK
ncbi:HNH endonuclease [Clostridium saccharobutylicum]|uniref:HNH endonuclease n=1 Tax=Clostridium saccharobutylicum TaxID=169679 RepID=UPI0018C8B0B9|nr:HNH endonuclease [Clostridium saccharobutylicum]NSB91091.1 putative nucleic acid-binding Zn ribbon protein [Clostridium saccharobutylicum]